MNPNETKEITLDDLAAMVSKGFKEQRDEFKSDMAEFRTEVRNEFATVRTEFKTEIGEFRAEVKEKFEDIRGDIDDFRKVVLLDHGRRLRKIESKLQIA